MTGFLGKGSEIDLQATISASSASTDVNPQPHHPIACRGQFFFHEDGRFECEHGASVPPDDIRTTHCIQHSIAILLIEEAVARFGQPNHP
jgi:hypothetical protein